MKITVAKSKTKSNAMYVSKEATKILTEYPRREALFSIMENDNGDHVPAIGIVPETSTKTGYKLLKREKIKLTGQCPKYIMDVGVYVMNGNPIFEDDMDWFLLEKQT